MQWLLSKKSSPYKHWEFLNIESHDRLRIVPERGGLITSWLCNGKEILYFDENRFADKSKSIRGGIPVLFPICGDLPGNILTLAKGNFKINQHGFVRDLPWKIALLNDQVGFSLSINSSQSTIKHYPYDFKIEMHVLPSSSSLCIHSFIYNNGVEVMPFSLGLHPYFKVNNLQKLSIKGMPSRCFNHTNKKYELTNKQLASMDSGVDFLVENNDFIDINDLSNNSKITLKAKPPMDLAVVWTDPPRKMVCLEPWTSPRNSLNTGERNLCVKPGNVQELYCKFLID